MAPSTGGEEPPHLDPDLDSPDELRQPPPATPAAVILDAAIGPRQGFDGEALGGDVSGRLRIWGIAVGAVLGGEWTGRLYDTDPDNVYLGIVLGRRQRTSDRKEVEILAEVGRRKVRVYRGLFEPGTRWITLPYVGVRGGVDWETRGPVRLCGGFWLVARLDLERSGVELATRGTFFGPSNTSFRHIGGLSLVVQIRIGSEIILGGG